MPNNGLSPINTAGEQSSVLVTPAVYRRCRHHHLLKKTVFVSIARGQLEGGAASELGKREAV